MAVIVMKGGFNVWPDLLNFLTNNLQEYGNEQQLTLVENSIKTISCVVEDCTSLFESEKYAELVDFMFPRVCSLLQIKENEKLNQFELSIKASALNTINMLVITSTEAVRSNIG